MPDIARDPSFLKKRRLRRIGYGVVFTLVLIGVSIVLARMEPAPPGVEAETLLRDTVKRGSFTRQVRGIGTLVPEDTRLIPATTDGRVEQILLRPGALVEANTVILELSNPAGRTGGAQRAAAAAVRPGAAREPARPVRERAADAGITGGGPAGRFRAGAHGR